MIDGQVAGISMPVPPRQGYRRVPQHRPEGHPQPDRHVSPAAPGEGFVVASSPAWNERRWVVIVGDRTAADDWRGLEAALAALSSRGGRRRVVLRIRLPDRTRRVGRIHRDRNRGPGQYRDPLGTVAPARRGARDDGRGRGGGELQAARSVDGPGPRRHDGVRRRRYRSLRVVPARPERRSVCSRRRTAIRAGGHQSRCSAAPAVWCATSGVT
jgi:hypothetical protein